MEREELGNQQVGLSIGAVEAGESDEVDLFPGRQLAQQPRPQFRIEIGQQRLLDQERTGVGNVGAQVDIDAGIRAAGDELVGLHEKPAAQQKQHEQRDPFVV